jgi:hypothetical protein
VIGAPNNMNLDNSRALGMEFSSPKQTDGGERGRFASRRLCSSADVRRVDARDGGIARRSSFPSAILLPSRFLLAVPTSAAGAAFAATRTVTIFRASPAACGLLSLLHVLCWQDMAAGPTCINAVC